MSDRLLVIGLEAQHERIESSSFPAVAPWSDYRVVAVDPAALPALWRQVGPGRDGRLVADSATDGGLGSTLVQVVRRRRREAAELLRAGGLLLCVLRPIGTPLHVRRHSPRGEGLAILHTYSWLPAEPSLTRLVLAAQQDPRIQPADEAHPAWQLLAAQGEAAAAEACVANEQLDPRWHVVATDRLGRPVALEVPVGQGRVLFVPPIAARDATERGALLVKLFAPPAAPQAPKPTAEPEWLSEYLLPRQAELATHLGRLEADIERLQADLAEARALHTELAELSKLLFASHPAELSEPVASALRLMDFEVTQTDPESLEVQSAEGRALLTTAAGEGIVDSDPYWSLLRRLDDEAPPTKGIIVGNAYCHTRPSVRGVPFSDILHRGAHHREICLLSAVELHAAVAALLARPDDEDLRRRLRLALLETTGPCLLAPLLSTPAGPS